MAERTESRRAKSLSTLLAENARCRISYIWPDYCGTLGPNYYIDRSGSIYVDFTEHTEMLLVKIYLILASLRAMKTTSQHRPLRNQD